MWLKKGLIFSERHSQLPTVFLDHVNGEVCVFYSTRKDGKSYIFRFFTSFDDPSTVIRSDNELVLGLGERGCFDDCGVMPSCVMQVGSERWLYYSGWNLNKGAVPYGHGIGLAIDSGEGFRRYSHGPILDRNTSIPFLCNSPFVWENEGYRMLFSCGSGWDGNVPHYFLCEASSSDGIRWEVGQPFFGGNEDIVSRSCVFGDKTYFASKTKDSPYNILEMAADRTVKEAELGDRADWEKDMRCYPCVFSLNSKIYMLYNGNGFGESGIGLAEKIDEET